MDRTDYPRIYREAGRISAAKQAVYKRLTVANLLLLAVGAVLTVLAPLFAPWSRALVGLGACCVLVAVVIWLVLGLGRPDNEWFDARAVAESLKTMTWRYIMNATPYGPSLADSEADRLFLAEISQVIQQKQKIGAQLECPAGQLEITSFMRGIRRESVENRLELYLDSRVRDQKTWYSSRSKQNRAAARLWFWSAFALQIAALIAAAVNVFTGATDLSALLVTLAALAMTWLQVQQSAYLAHSYGSAAQEFAIIESKAAGIRGETELGDYVEQAELAASREHTLWIARNVL